MKYAVAVANLSEGENKVSIVEAENPVDAIMKGAGDTERYYSTVDEAIEHYLNGDILVSEPVEI